MSDMENRDERQKSLDLDAKRDAEAKGDRLTARDVVAGAAHAAQLSGVGGPAAHVAAQAVGAADAAIVAKDLAQGKDVRPLDVATAAASVTLTAGVGGPAAQGLAKGVAAVGALDAGERALNSARDAVGDQRVAEPPTAREVAARREIEVGNEGAMAVTRDGVDSTTARSWVRDDLASLSAITSKDERYQAAVSIGDNAHNQVAYKAELAERAPAVLEEAQAAYRENLRRASEKDVALSPETVAAAEAVGRSSDTMLAMQPNTMDAERAKAAVRDDIAALRSIDNDVVRGAATYAMGQVASTQSAYRDELRAQAPAIAAEVEVAYRDNDPARDAKDSARLESVAERSLSERHGAAREGGQTIESVKEDVARQMARDDLADLGKLKSQERLVEAAVIVQDNMRNPAYKAEFEKVDPEAVRAVDMLARQGAARLTPEAEKRDTLTIDAVTSERLAAVRERDTDAALQAMGKPRNENEVSERFIANLDQRMAASELGELGWKDRTDISDVMADLEKLAGKDWNKAAELWQKYRPDDIDKPSFIDGNEIESVRAKGADRGDAANDEKAPEGNKRSAEKDDDVFKVPESLQKKFMHADGKFYFRDEQKDLAFEDSGKRLETKHNNPEVAKSMIELAEAKGWTSIKVKGSEEFKREVWLQASLKGMEVKGFQPKDVDLAKLEALRQEAQRDRVPNTIERDVERERAPLREATTERARPNEKVVVNLRESATHEQERGLSNQERVALKTLETMMRARGDSEQAVATVREVAMEKFQTTRVYVGKVVDQGVSHYNNDPKETLTPFVKLETSQGEKVVWGVDLPRATKEGGVKVGDEVALAYQGKQPVTVKVPVLDEQGKDTGRFEEKAGHRNTWDMRKFDTLREEAQVRVVAAAERAAAQPLVKVYDRDAPRAEARVVPEVQRARDNERARG